MNARLNDLRRFYAILSELEERLGGRRCLADCHGRMDWPQRGVYFFMEEGERRSDSGEGLRIVRVGTHALTASSRTTLWKRLSQHKGQDRSGGGKRPDAGTFTTDGGRRGHVDEQYDAGFLEVVERLVRDTERPV